MAATPPHKLKPLTDGEIPDGIEKASQSFVSAAELLTNYELARVYTDILLNQPTTNSATANRLDLAESTTSKRVSRLEEIGIVEDAAEGREKQNVADPILFQVRLDGSETLVTPTVIAAFGAQEGDEEIKTFLERHGRAKLVDAVQYTLAYLDGDLTRRSIGEEMGIPAVEAIAITQAIEPIIALVQTVDAAIPELEYEVHDRKLRDAPYTIEGDE